MKIVYVAGRFRGVTAWDVAENVRAAERVGFEVAKLGAMPLIPYANTAHFDGTLTAQRERLALAAAMDEPTGGA